MVIHGVKTKMSLHRATPNRFRRAKCSSAPIHESNQKGGLSASRKCLARIISTQVPLVVQDDDSQQSPTTMAADPALSCSQSLCDGPPLCGAAQESLPVAAAAGVKRPRREHSLPLTQVIDLGECSRDSNAHDSGFDSDESEQSSVIDIATSGEAVPSEPLLPDPNGPSPTSHIPRQCSAALRRTATQISRLLGRLTSGTLAGISLREATPTGQNRQRRLDYAPVEGMIMVLRGSFSQFDPLGSRRGGSSSENPQGTNISGFSRFVNKLNPVNGLRNFFSCGRKSSSSEQNDDIRSFELTPRKAPTKDSSPKRTPQTRSRYQDGNNSLPSPAPSSDELKRGLPPLTYDCCQTFSTVAATLLSNCEYWPVVDAIWRQSTMNYLLYVSAWLHQCTAVWWSRCGTQRRPSMADLTQHLCLQRCPGMTVSAHPEEFSVVFYNEGDKAGEMVRALLAMRPLSERQQEISIAISAERRLSPFFARRSLTASLAQASSQACDHGMPPQGISPARLPHDTTLTAPIDDGRASNDTMEENTKHYILTQIMHNTPRAARPSPDSRRQDTDQDLSSPQPVAPLARTPVPTHSNAEPRSKETQRTQPSPYDEPCGFVIVSGDYAVSVASVVHPVPRGDPNGLGQAWTLLLIDSHGKLPWSERKSAITAVHVATGTGQTVSGPLYVYPNGQKVMSLRDGVKHFCLILFALLEEYRDEQQLQAASRIRAIVGKDQYRRLLAAVKLDIAASAENYEKKKHACILPVYHDNKSNKGSKPGSPHLPQAPKAEPAISKEAKSESNSDSDVILVDSEDSDNNPMHAAYPGPPQEKTTVPQPRNLLIPDIKKTQSIPPIPRIGNALKDPLAAQSAASDNPINHTELKAAAADGVVHGLFGHKPRCRYVSTLEVLSSLPKEALITLTAELRKHSTPYMTWTPLYRRRRDASAPPPAYAHSRVNARGLMQYFIDQEWLPRVFDQNIGHGDGDCDDNDIGQLRRELFRLTGQYNLKPCFIGVDDT